MEGVRINLVYTRRQLGFGHRRGLWKRH